MKIKDRNGFTLVEIMIVIAIIGLLVAIAIPNYVRARKYSLQRQIEETALQTVSSVEPGSLVDLANKFGSTGVAENPIGYGTYLIKGNEIIDDVPLGTIKIRFVGLSEMNMAIDKENGAYRKATLREVLSCRSFPTNTDIVVLGSYKLSDPKDPGSRQYPIICDRSLSFGSQREWPSNTLFAIVKKPL